MATVTNFKRSCFTKQEKLLLIDIFNHHKHILENKKTDATTCKQKESTWGLVAKQFKAQSTGAERTAKQLMNCYKNIKADAKKHLAADKDLVSDWSEVDVDWQQKILDATVSHPHFNRYPPSFKYCISFLKYIITQLERSCSEIADGIYESYTYLLSQDVTQSGFKTYKLGSDNYVVLRESSSIISQGTTGLCTWQAALFLAEWILENKDKFSNKKLLELGSGTGLTGLVACRTCPVKEFVFSDCHEEVLKLLEDNVKENLENTGRYIINNCAETNLSSSLDMDKNCDGVPIRISNLNWESVTDNDLENLGSTVDAVIAADVVYDDRIIPSLVRVLSRLLRPKCSQFKEKTAIICSTVRNPTTIERFNTACLEAGIFVKKVKGPEDQYLYYDRSSEIQLVELSASQENVY